VIKFALAHLNILFTISPYIDPLVLYSVCW